MNKLLLSLVVFVVLLTIGCTTIGDVTAIDNSEDTFSQENEDYLQMSAYEQEVIEKNTELETLKKQLNDLENLHINSINELANKDKKIEDLEQDLKKERRITVEKIYSLLELLHSQSNIGFITFNLNITKVDGKFVENQFTQLESKINESMNGKDEQIEGLRDAISDEDRLIKESSDVNYKFTEYYDYSTYIEPKVRKLTNTSASGTSYNARYEGSVYFVMNSPLEWRKNRYWAVEVNAETGELVKLQEATTPEGNPDFSVLWWTQGREE